MVRPQDISEPPDGTSAAVELSVSTWRQPWPPRRHARFRRSRHRRRVRAAPGLDAYWDLRIWVDVEPDEALRRVLDRDAARDGASGAEALLRERYGSAEDLYMAEADPVARADLVVDNTVVADPRLVRG